MKASGDLAPADDHFISFASPKGDIRHNVRALIRGMICFEALPDEVVEPGLGNEGADVYNCNLRGHVVNM